MENVNEGEVMYTQDLHVIVDVGAPFVNGVEIQPGVPCPLSLLSSGLRLFPMWKADPEYPLHAVKVPAKE